MKKIITTAVLAILFSMTSLAQTPLKGSWSISQSMMGTKITDILSFDNDIQGQATNKFVIDMKISTFGVKIIGSAEITIKGDFTSEGDKLTINWEQDSFEATQTPIELYVMGEKVEDDKEEYEDMMGDIIR